MAKLKAELKETVARDGEMFLQGQDFVKKEFAKRFPAKKFSWIDDIFLDKEDENENGQDEDRTIEDNPPVPTSTVIVIDKSVIEVREACPIILIFNE